MVYCQKCGTENPEDAQFCSRCGNYFPKELHKISLWRKILGFIITLLGLRVLIYGIGIKGVPLWAVGVLGFWLILLGLMLIFRKKSWFGGLILG